MQNALFPDSENAASITSPLKRPTAAKVLPAAFDAALQALAIALPPRLYLGTSSWTFPGWTGLVWADDYSNALLAKHGLHAYAQHPLFRAVSLDRTFYRPLNAGQYAAYAAQVPDDFRFVVKAPSLICDALVRDETGRGMIVNRNFLNPELALRECIQPATEGLEHRLGALVFQLSPLPHTWLDRFDLLLDRLATMLQGLPAQLPESRDAVIAIEVRDPLFLSPEHAPEFIRILRKTGATYCLGLHAKMPTIAEQLPILRALWPAPLVCRWNLHRRHSAYGYDDARQLYAPFDKLVDPDPEIRSTLARVIAGTTAAGHAAYVTLNNKAEGSAPLSVAALAEAVQMLGKHRPDQASSDCPATPNPLQSAPRVAR